MKKISGIHDKLPSGYFVASLPLHLHFIENYQITALLCKPNEQLVDLDSEIEDHYKSRIHESLMSEARYRVIHNRTIGSALRSGR